MTTLLTPRPTIDPASIEAASIDLATRREFLAALAAAGLLAGCGTEPPTTPPPRPPASPAPSPTSAANWNWPPRRPGSR